MTVGRVAAVHSDLIGWPGQVSARAIHVFQGRAMGHLSEIKVRLGFAGDTAIGCLLGGAVR